MGLISNIKYKFNKHRPVIEIPNNANKIKCYYCGKTLKSFKRVVDKEFKNQFDLLTIGGDKIPKEKQDPDKNIIGKIIGENRLCRTCKKPRDQHKWTGDIGRCPTHWGLYN